MELNNMMRAQSVQRWHTIDTSRSQSVAEHSFNVAMIVGTICEQLGYNRGDTDRMMRRALNHDLDEVFNGDPPASSKDEVELPQDREQCIIKMADLMEAHWFINNYGIGPTGEKAVRGNYERWCRAMDQLAKKHFILYDVMEEVRIAMGSALGRR